MFLIDVPHSGNAEPDAAAERYVRMQLEELVGVLEGITGQPLDQGRLAECIRLSGKASELWTQILESGTSRPSPISVFDQFIAMAPIVSQRGTEVAVAFYRELLEEIQERVQQEIGAVGEERFRLFWDNLPIWPELRGLATFLDEKGACMVTSLYTNAWSTLAIGKEDPFGDWTRQYLYTANLHLSRRIDQYVDFAHRYQLDGFLYHSNRSCKMVSQDIPEVRRAVTERAGAPGVILEADHNDPRLYALESILGQIETFLDMLASRKTNA
jgi:benzoyl-CoA reductase/2-hydroxyglutaryl-CoA dehydratase subunit BcrC/BadD/HgdB